MRMPLEMRIMADSDVLMAPQRGNKNGTCAIEVLTPRFMENEWKGFAQAVLDQWMTLRNWNEQKLNIRPHWAKEWYVSAVRALLHIKIDCLLSIGSSTLSMANPGYSISKKPVTRPKFPSSKLPSPK